MKEIKQIVKDKYNEIAEGSDMCCGSACGYSIQEDYGHLEGHVSDADLSLGCGLPTEHAGIREGHTVVDLGSGAGNDVFVARSIVGETGRVIGIDMAETMYEKAIANNAKLGFNNVEFRLGDIEDIPLSNCAADVVVSNCVLNLVPDKAKAYSETYRILKPGGHFSISDVVITGALPEDLKKRAEVYVGCVAGALQRDEYLGIIKQAGFVNLRVAAEREINLDIDFLSAEERALLDESGAGIYSITVTAQKPADVNACC